MYMTPYDISKKSVLCVSVLCSGGSETWVYHQHWPVHCTAVLVAAPGRFCKVWFFVYYKDRQSKAIVSVLSPVSDISTVFVATLCQLSSVGPCAFFRRLDRFSGPFLSGG